MEGYALASILKVKISLKMIINCLPEIIFEGIKYLAGKFYD